MCRMSRTTKRAHGPYGAPGGHESGGVPDTRRLGALPWGWPATRSLDYWCFEPANEPDPDLREHLTLLPLPLGVSTHHNILWTRGPAGHQEKPMEVLNAHCAGLDIHKKTVVACRLCSSTGGSPEKE